MKIKLDKNLSINLLEVLAARIGFQIQKTSIERKEKSARLP